LTDTAPPGGPPALTPVVVELVVDEDLTTEAAGRLNTHLLDALRMRPAQLVVDLSRCEYAEALAIDVLLKAHRRAYQYGGRLTLRSPSPRVLRLLRLARVHEVFHMVAVTS
jgi:anti-anti-sigma factor